MSPTAAARESAPLSEVASNNARNNSSGDSESLSGSDVDEDWLEGQEAADIQQDAASAVDSADDAGPLPDAGEPPQPATGRRPRGRPRGSLNRPAAAGEPARDTLTEAGWPRSNAQQAANQPADGGARSDAQPAHPSAGGWSRSTAQAAQAWGPRSNAQLASSAQPDGTVAHGVQQTRFPHQAQHQTVRQTDPVTTSDGQLMQQRLPVVFSPLDQQQASRPPMTSQTRLATDSASSVGADAVESL